MTEIVRYSLIGKEDIAIQETAADTSFSVTLPDGTVVVLTKLALNHLTAFADVDFGGFSATNLAIAVSNPLTLDETISGQAENAGQIHADFTDETGGSEDSDLIFKLRQAGAALTEKFRIKNTGDLDVEAGADIIGGVGEILFNDDAANPSAAGRMRRSGADLKFHDGTAVRTVIFDDDELAEFPSGTRMVFDQDTAPSGWTRQNVTGERVIRLAEAGDTGATTGGSWTISGVTVDSYTLAEADIPAHTHNQSAATTSTGGTTRLRGTGSAHSANVASTSTGGGGGHTHGLTADGTWRPAFRIMIVADKD